ncbi:hypothetical protein ABOM_001776, partial [Aspergillus bombycis]
IEITGNVRLPGKNLGLFCNNLLVSQRVTVDVSGDKGKVGDNKTDNDGGIGGPGMNGGNIWIFVQDLAAGDLDNVDIYANGGDGGRGGNTSAKGKKGGRGGNAGNGGLIEIIVGSQPAEAMSTFNLTDKQPWPEKVSSLLQLDLSEALFNFLNEEQRKTLNAYDSLGSVLSSLVDTIQRMPAKSQTENVKVLTSKVLDQIKKNLQLVKKSPVMSEENVKGLKKLLSQIASQHDVATDLEEISRIMGELSASSGSQLDLLLDTLYLTMDSAIIKTKRRITWTLRNNKAGASGPGGISGPGIDPGPRGEEGKVGESWQQFLDFEGTKNDLNTRQAYIFPEQCQMLLNKIDNQFFSAQWTERTELIRQYNRLVKRLRIVDTIDDKTDESTGLWKAVDMLENTYQVTTNAQSQLKAVAVQARSRRNRLLLGQDMFGHSQSWVPRLSYDFYANSIDKRLGVLREIENLEREYQQADQKSVDLRAVLDNGIEKMQTTETEASTIINLLTGPNGEIYKKGVRIGLLTVELKEKRDKVRTEVAHVKFDHVYDPVFLIDGFSSLTSLKPDLDSLGKLWKLATDIHKFIEHDTINDGQGKEFKEEFVIRQLAECTGSLESLEAALKTNNDNTISISDPKALKVMAKISDIEKLMKDFSECIPEDQRKNVNKALKEYKNIILKRNDAVVGYNSSIQLLVEARCARKHAQEQASSLRGKRLKLDPTIPAVSFWLRGTKDKLALQLMQRLYYASRAVMYWGLDTSYNFDQPGPLRSSTELRSHWTQLDNAFEAILHRYAGNVRSIWPHTEAKQGLFYGLTSAQLETLKTGQCEEEGEGKVYKVSITLQPKAMPFGRPRADVRLSEVRLWLVGAKVCPDTHGRQRVTVHIRHMGDDLFEDESNKRFHFSHDSMTIPFEFDAAKVKNKCDFTADAKLNAANAWQDQWTGNQSRKDIGINCVAAVGPFTTWCLEVRESENPGLDMGLVESAYMEFCGANRSFIRRPKSG